MKIIVLGIRGMPNVQGGVETHAEQLYPRLAALGCDVEVLVRTPFVPRGIRSVGRIRIRRLWSPRRVGVEALFHSIIGLFYAAVARPDILHIHGIGPAIVTPIARILGLKVVVTHHGRDYEREKWGFFGRWVLRLGECVGMRHAHARIAISKVISDFVLTTYGREAVLIPNGVVAVAACADDQHVRKFGLVPGRYFLQVSRMVPEKRQLDLIRAYAAGQPIDWKLALVGAIDNDAYSRKVVAAATVPGVILTGFLRGEPLQQLYSHAGAFVLPSSHEGLPIALLEAMSYGLPVLASDIPANLEVGLESTSYFPTGDPFVLARRLTELMQAPRDDDMRDSRRRWIAQKYNWDRIAELTLKVYLTLKQDE